MFDNLNPIFNNDKPNKINNNKQQRKPRSDKRHPARFPVDLQLQAEFKRSLNRFKRIYPDLEVKQTKYNTLLLLYALNNPEIIRWDMVYKDSDTYMTTKLLKAKFEEIGGDYGIAINRGMSWRKAIFMMTVSALRYIEKGGYYDEVFQQIQFDKVQTK